MAGYASQATAVANPKEDKQRLSEPIHIPSPEYYFPIINTTAQERKTVPGWGA